MHWPTVVPGRGARRSSGPFLYPGENSPRTRHRGPLLPPFTRGEGTRDSGAWPPQVGSRNGSTLGHGGPGSGPSTRFSHLSFQTREPVYSNVFNLTTPIFNNSKFKHVLISLPAALRGVTGGRGRGHCEGGTAQKSWEEAGLARDSDPGPPAGSQLRMPRAGGQAPRAVLVTGGPAGLPQCPDHSWGTITRELRWGSVSR